MTRKLKNVEKCETHTVGPAKWEKKTEKSGKWDTVYELEYGEKLWKTWKMRNAHSRT